jgi:hypothetical protein
MPLPSSGSPTLKNGNACYYQSLVSIYKSQTIVTQKIMILIKIVPNLCKLNQFSFTCRINISFELFQVFLKHPGKERGLTTRVSNQSVITQPTTNNSQFCDKHNGLYVERK